MFEISKTEAKEDLGYIKDLTGERIGIRQKLFPENLNKRILWIIFRDR